MKSNKLFFAFILVSFIFTYLIYYNGHLLNQPLEYHNIINGSEGVRILCIIVIGPKDMNVTVSNSFRILFNKTVIVLILNVYQF